jgi:hypothetical protein
VKRTTPTKSTKKRLTTPIKISNEYLGEANSSASFITTLENEIEALRAKRTASVSDSDDEDDFKFHGEVSAPVDSIYDLEAILNSDNIDIEKWSLPLVTPLVTTEEDQLKDVDNKIIDLFSSINLKTKSIKN